jgi:hypothetical protein
VASRVAGLRGGLPGVRCRVASPAAGLRGGVPECSGPSSNIFKSFGRAMASTSPARLGPGWPVQLRVYAVVHQGTELAGSPVQPQAYAVAAHLRQALFLSRHTGRSVVRWPRLPRAVGAAAGRSRPPGIVQLRSSSSCGSPRRRSLQVACLPRTKRGHSGSAGGRFSCGRQCATWERQAASPAAGLRGGGLSEWPATGFTVGYAGPLGVVG